uniref:Aminoglycoside phosphotransferase n=1 Tax=Solibacter usitatus (strain Ellin6076) TaxID=234267 RepID=Q01SN1_SOLUE
MFLTEANVLDYLTGRGFAGPEFVVRGEWTVRNLSRRNRNFRVTRGGREFLVKQAGTWDLPGRASIEREADLCRRAATDPCFGALRPLVPDVYSYDPDHSILIFEFLPDEASLSDVPERLDARTARLAGELMADYHRQMQSAALAEHFPGSLPGYFSMHRWDSERLVTRSQGQRELVRLVKRHAAFAPALESAAAEWRPGALIHGDWKLENCLISNDGARMHVVDWELAGWGDARWDVATLLQSWWKRWVRDPAEYRLEAMRPELRALLNPSEDEVAAILRFAAVRMLQSAWESLQDIPAIHGEAVRMAQVSLNILTNPEWAGEAVFGHD